MAPRVLICGTLTWTAGEVSDILGTDVAEVVLFDSSGRADFIKAFESNGKYAGVVAMYRDSSLFPIIGDFDKELITILANAGVKWIAHNGAGYDMIDVKAIKETGIKLSNTPGAVDEGTATIAFYLMISAMRQLSLSERSLRAGQWKPKNISHRSHDLPGRTLAILGLGGIGIRFAEMARGAFNMRIIYHSRNRNPKAPEYCEYFENVEEMLKETDVLSVHVPLNPNTVGLVGEKMIRGLKKGAIIVNTARGKVIDEEAMIRALEDGHLASVGLDVFPNEPEVNPRLLQFDNITLVPHMGTETQDSQRAMEVRALTNVKDYLTTGAGKDLVPELK